MHVAKIVHVYPKSFGFGGIENYIEGHKHFFSKEEIEVVWETSPDTRKDSVNIFHSFLPKVMLQLILFITMHKRRVIVVAHHHPPEYCKNKMKLTIYLTLFGYIIRFLRIRDFILFIVHTEKENSSLVKFLGNINTHILPIGLRSDVKIQKVNNVAEINKRFDFITIARNDDVKRLRLVFELARKLPSTNFLLISTLDDKAQFPANLTIYQNVDENAKFEMLSQSRFYFSPSAYESLGIAIAEAESIGIPALVDLNTGYLSAVDHNDLTHLTYELNTLEDQINKLLSLSENDYLDLSQRAKIRAEKVSWQFQCKRFEKLLEQCHNNDDIIY